MPIYEYKCQECGKSFEFLKRGNEVPQCPHCKSIDLKKLMSRFNSNTGSNGSASCNTCSGGACATCGK